MQAIESWVPIESKCQVFLWGFCSAVALLSKLGLTCLTGAVGYLSDLLWAGSYFLSFRIVY